MAACCTASYKLATAPYGEIGLGVSGPHLMVLRISDTLRFCFNSCGRPICDGFRQFRPYQMPIVGAKVAAGDCAAGGALDGDAMPNGDRAVMLILVWETPMRHGRRRNAQYFGQRLVAPHDGYGRMDRFMWCSHAKSLAYAKLLGNSKSDFYFAKLGRT